MVKICSLCGIEKSLDEFHKLIHSKDGYRNRCKECRKPITKKYREENANVGCIYCCPDPVSQKIPAESIMFILEMNNDTNKIMGIGMVRNKSLSRRIQVYKDGNYNRYVYTGKLRISREEMNTEEETIMKVFDQLCFKGNRHMKRGQGLKSFPIEMLYNCSRMLDLVDFISKMFKTRLSDKYEKETN